MVRSLRYEWLCVFVVVHAAAVCPATAAAPVDKKTDKSCDREQVLGCQTVPTSDRDGCSIAIANSTSSMDKCIAKTQDGQIAELESRQLNMLHGIVSLDIADPTITERSLLEVNCVKTVDELKIFDIKFGRPLLDRIYANTALRTLYIVNAGIGDQDLEGIRNLEGLKDLALNENHISDRGAAKLSRLARLEGLNLDFTEVGNESLNMIAVHMKNLQRLDIKGTRVTDSGIKVLAELKNLYELSLQRTRVSDECAKQLVSLKSLDTLDLTETDVTNDLLNKIGALSSLGRLYVGKTRISGRGLGALKDFVKLRVLALQWLQVSNPDLLLIEHLRALEELYLDGTAVTDSGLVHLEQLPNLKILGLGNTLVTDAGKAKLAKRCPGITFVDSDDD